MRTKLFLTALAVLAFINPASAQKMEDSMSPATMTQHEGNTTFHMFRLEIDYGVDKNDPVSTWDWRGWIGGDVNKLWLRSEGSHANGKTDKAEVWALYSRSIATFWDAQAGIRYDAAPRGTPYLTLGFTGLAPYYFDTEAHLFIAQNGAISARLREENDFQLTQKLITQPYAEINASSRRVDKREIGAGLTDGEIGVQTRYEFTRKFAPYVDVRYERKFGATSSLAQQSGEDTGGLSASLGLRLMF